MILLISASQIARITDVRHRHPAVFIWKGKMTRDDSFSFLTASEMFGLDD
jgi:hypothetical protein